jgi:large subunit ribosomal protein L15
MQFHTFEYRSLKRSRTRIGRGGKRGSYSGRGVKGQKSRAGRRMRPAQRDLLLKIPKRRGFANRPTTLKSITLNLGDLNRLATRSSSGVVDKAFLIEQGKISGSYRGTIKVLGKGELQKPLRIKGFLVSKSARVKIEKAGGSLEA